MSVVLRVDPWSPEYGASLDGEGEAGGPPPSIEFDIETGPWGPISPPTGLPLPNFAFIDGVRRIDIRLFAENGDSMVPALAGSWGVGTAWSGQPAVIGEVHVGRCIVMGGGVTHPDVETTVGADHITYKAESVDGVTVMDPLKGLHNAMRRQEEKTAREIVDSRLAELVMLDGPLTYFSNSPTIGLIKRQSRRYLEGARQAVLPELAVGQRSPMFMFESQQLQRYSWYARIGPRREIDGTLTGLVRLEVPAVVGRETAQELAGITTAALPQFSAPSWRDARSPQNLHPVGQLERILRHRLGDPILMKRALEAALWKDAHA